MPERMVAGKKIVTEEQKISLEMLKLDPLNVRFSHFSGPLLDEQLEKIIWEEDDTRELMKSIRASKGLLEPPLVVKENGYYLTKEGNRRVVALRKLKEAVDRKEVDDFSPDYFKRIPCEVLPKKITPTEMDLILAIYHVSGKKEWDALNKASHIYKLHQKQGFTYEDIAKHLGVSKATIKRALDAYEECQKYLQKYPKDPLGIRRFTYFDEFFKKTYLRKKALMDRSLLDEFHEWLAAGKFKTHRDVRNLPEILEDPDAAKAIRKSHIDDALKTLYTKFPELSDPLWETVASTVNALRNMPRSEVHALLEDSARGRLFMSLVKEVEAVKKDLERAKRGG